VFERTHLATSFLGAARSALHFSFRFSSQLCNRPRWLAGICLLPFSSSFSCHAHLLTDCLQRAHDVLVPSLSATPLPVRLPDLGMFASLHSATRIVQESPVQDHFAWLHKLYPFNSLVACARVCLMSVFPDDSNVSKLWILLCDLLYQRDVRCKLENRQRDISQEEDNDFDRDQVPHDEPQPLPVRPSQQTICFSYGRDFPFWANRRPAGFRRLRRFADVAVPVPDDSLDCAPEHAPLHTPDSAHYNIECINLTYIPRKFCFICPRNSIVALQEHCVPSQKAIVWQRKAKREGCTILLGLTDPESL